MSAFAFAVTLDRLLRQLDLVESETAAPASARSAHVKRATIRLRRAYAALQDAGPRAPVESLVRLKGRAQEVEQALVDSDSAPPPHAQHARELARQIVHQIEMHLAVAVTESESESGSGTGGGHHSRTPSTSDLPRRVPSSSSSKSTTAPDQPILPFKDTVQRRAQALSDCYTLARLAKSGVVPSGKPLSSLPRLGSGGDTAASEGATPSPRERQLEAQIKAQLRRAYFDSFRPLFRPGENGGQRAAAWTRLAQDLVEAVIPLIPPRMSADPALYPTSAAAAADRTTSMRAAVERDLISTATASATVQAQGEEEYLPKLERLVRVLQRLCAPARDPDVRAILDKLGAATGPGTTPAPEKLGDCSIRLAVPHHAQQSEEAVISSSDLPSSTISLSQSQSQQPDLVVDFVRGILDLAEAMRADLDRFHTELKKNQAVSSNASTTSLSEQELARVVEREAAMRERAVVIEWYGGQEENVRRATRRWCSDRSVGAAAGRSGLAVPESFSSVAAADPTTLLDRVTGSREEFAIALVETLFASQPVAVPSLEETPPLPPVERNNLLPPPLVVLAPLLFELQNQFQALVILACLATIASSSSSSSSTVSSPPPGAAADASALLERMWTILDMNITKRPVAEEERTVPGSAETNAVGMGACASSAADHKEEEGTRLAHLADEILAHLTTAAASEDPPPVERAADPDPDLQKRKRVRASVDRILRYEDPVWKLFSNRLEGAVKTALLDVVRSGDNNMTSPSSDQVQPQVPAHLRTGRSTSSSADVERRRGPPLPPLPRTGTERRAAADHVAGMRPVKVKGFDKPAFLADKVSELVRDRLVGEVWVHVEEVWGTILGWAE